VNFSKWPGGAFPDGQRAYFATSEDLIHWTPAYNYTPGCTEAGVFGEGTQCLGGVAAPYSNGSVPFIIDTRYYQYKGGWDTLSGFPLDEADHSQGVVGYWNADPTAAYTDRHMSWGFGQSEDGLRWTAQRPPTCAGTEVEFTGLTQTLGQL
jgi:hypothetical protein